MGQIDLPTLRHVNCLGHNNQLGNLNETKAIRIMNEWGFLQDPSRLFRINECNGVAHIEFAGSFEESLFKALAQNKISLFPMIGESCLFLSAKKDYYLNNFFIKPACRLIEQKRNLL